MTHGTQSIRIIRDEHRSLTAVLHGMAWLVGEIRDRAMAPDFALFGKMIHYIDAFPERFHHPKEDRYLFRLLRERFPAAAPLLDRLGAEHRTGAELIRGLEEALTRYQQGGAAEYLPFAAAVEAYLEFHWRHMRAEETEVIPLAQQHLTEADWLEVDEAFLGHSDPMLGANAHTEYRDLFRRIVHLAPPPIGVGPPR